MKNNSLHHIGDLKTRQAPFFNKASLAACEQPEGQLGNESADVSLLLIFTIFTSLS